MLTVGSLFSGIGGIELGLEWTGGFKTVWQVECDPYAQKVLAKHWPDVGRWDDVRTFPPTPAEDWRCDVICGGFPCQGISDAGKRFGLSDPRSGLLFEAIRVVSELRPRFVLLENVSALLHRGMGAVVRDLAEIGYSVEWSCIPAAAVGAPHIRDRVFILADANGHEQRRRYFSRRETEGRAALGRVGEEVANACVTRLETSKQETVCGTRRRKEGRTVAERDWWSAEPDVGRVADGVPHRVDRLRCLGNAVVPQVAQWIGERILEAIEDNTALPRQ